MRTRKIFAGERSGVLYLTGGREIEFPVTALGAFCVWERWPDKSPGELVEGACLAWNWIRREGVDGDLAALTFEDFAHQCRNVEWRELVTDPSLEEGDDGDPPSGGTSPPASPTQPASPSETA